jgi:hypothetical protein
MENVGARCPACRTSYDKEIKAPNPTLATQAKAEARKQKSRERDREREVKIWIACFESNHCICHSNTIACRIAFRPSDGICLLHLSS